MNDKDVDSKTHSHKEVSDNKIAENFWINAFSILGALVGYQIASSNEMTMWLSLLMALVGAFIIRIAAGMLKRQIAVVGAIGILLLFLYGIYEGIVNAAVC